MSSSPPCGGESQPRPPLLIRGGSGWHPTAPKYDRSLSETWSLQGGPESQIKKWHWPQGDTEGQQARWSHPDGSHHRATGPPGMEVDLTNLTEEPESVWGMADTGKASPPQLSESAVLLCAFQSLREEMGAMRAEQAALKSQTTTLRGSSLWQCQPRARNRPLTLSPPSRAG